MSRLIEIGRHKIGRRAPELLNLAELKRRGWTEKLIRQFAGPADDLAVNPHHPAGPAMRLYQTARIREIEASPAYIKARAIADRCRTAATKGLKTKAQNAAAAAGNRLLSHESRRSKPV